MDALQTTPPGSLKKSRRKSAPIAAPETIAEWFQKPERNLDNSRGGLHQQTACSVTGQSLTIETYNHSLANKQRYDILDHTLIGHYSPFVLSIIECFSRTARGLPGTEKDVIVPSESSRQAIISAMGEEISRSTTDISPNALSKMIDAGIVSFGILATLSSQECTNISGADGRSTRNKTGSKQPRSGIVSALTTRKLQSFHDIWFNTGCALKHRRATVNAQECDHYAPAQILQDIETVVWGCHGPQLNNITQPTARLAAIAAENALRIAFTAHSATTRLTLAHGRNAEIAAYININDIGRELTTELAVRSMHERHIKKAEEILADKVGHFERDRAKVIWTPR